MKRGYEDKGTREDRKSARVFGAGKKIGALVAAAAATTATFAIVGKYSDVGDRLPASHQERERPCYPLETVALGATVRAELGSDTVYVSMLPSGDGKTRASADTIPIESLPGDEVCLEGQYVKGTSTNYDGGVVSRFDHTTGNETSIQAGSETLRFEVLKSELGEDGFVREFTDENE